MIAKSWIALLGSGERGGARRRRAGSGRRARALLVDGEHPLDARRRRLHGAVLSRRGRVYLNRFERECVGLARHGKFTYQVQTGARHARLCATDTITVLERNGRGFNCDLGMFEPISRDEADSFLVGPNNAVVSTPIELPKDEEPAPE